MVRRRRGLDDESDGAFRRGTIPPSTDKHPFVLTGPADQVGSRDIRPRSVRLSHLGPDVRDALDPVTSGSNDNGRFWRVGPLLVCTHKLTDLSSGASTWTYPRLFGQAPRVTAVADSTSARTVTVSSVSAGQVTIRAFDSGGAAQNPDVEVIAVGVDS